MQAWAIKAPSTNIPARNAAPRWWPQRSLNIGISLAGCTGSVRKTISASRYSRWRTERGVRRGIDRYGLVSGGGAAGRAPAVQSDHPFASHALLKGSRILLRRRRSMGRTKPAVEGNAGNGGKSFLRSPAMALKYCIIQSCGLNVTARMDNS